ncbi:MAG: aminopeptidase N [Deltaproteobacteria bacterium]|nr:aminopeptidase N [Deltaproteobacteria bacterium]
MSADTHQLIYRKDYLPPPYLIDTVELHFSLGEKETVVISRLACRRNGASAAGLPLVLDGEELELLSVLLDGGILDPAEYESDQKSLTIHRVPETFQLEITTRIHPDKNTALEGLYRSGGNYCTQCEAQGFRKITYFPDRPDVMSRFTTTIEAERSVPVLLANGNLMAAGEKGEGRHYATWRDPFPKPCYLFALVAGDLVRIADTHVTGSGRTIALHIYVQKHNSDRCGHAMRSLRKAMAWDEKFYGLEYDLDLFMIVAVDDFNMGAMENKGLNVFNSKYVLAKPQTATDDDYAGIEGVVAHEYFHNWTGNRVTCRDWFQLSLKEGLTVFRDQQFSADMGSAAVKRIHDVRALRNFQFVEDCGPMAHPVRPDAYIEINNFYTVTVYEKGAELIRMMHTMLGREGFRRGMDLYFARYDGQAVTCDDFIRAMEDGGGVDLGQFRNWYSQAGTPGLRVTRGYDPESSTCRLEVVQDCPPTPGQEKKEPFHIPLAVGLLDSQGRDMELCLQGRDMGRSVVLDVKEKRQTFVFEQVREKPVPSLLRGFSAPVKLHYDYTGEELRFLLAHDSDPFNRWEAGQLLASRLLLRLVKDYRQGEEPLVDPGYVSVFRDLLSQAGSVEPAFLAELLTLPSEKYLGEQLEVIDVEAIHQSRLIVRRTLAALLKDSLLEIYHENNSLEPYRYDQRSAGKRRLKNTALAYLMLLDDPAMMDIGLRQFEQSGNMTDVLAALECIVYNADCPERKSVLVSFYSEWQKDTLVLDKWFSLQATAPLPDTLVQVKDLLNHPAFALKNPNKVRALIGAFCGGNQLCFHDKSGEGYRFLADQVLAVDRINHQIAARLLNPLSRWRRFDASRQTLMRRELERILAGKELSRDVYEVASKSLGAGAK